MLFKKIWQAFRPIDACFLTKAAQKPSFSITVQADESLTCFIFRFLKGPPLGFGVPGADGAHFMLDMSMSVVARAKIRNALKAGESIPDTWGTDKHGRNTTDPKAALDGFLQPIGGHKGYGLALMVDMFAGVLSNAAYLTHVKSWVDAPDEPQNLGHFFILIDTKRLGSSSWLVERMRDFAQILHASPAAEEGKPVIVPGEIELRNMARQRANAPTRQRANAPTGFMSMQPSFRCFSNAPRTSLLDRNKETRMKKIGVVLVVLAGALQAHAQSYGSAMGDVEFDSIS